MRAPDQGLAGAPWTSSPFYDHQRRRFQRRTTLSRSSQPAERSEAPRPKAEVLPSEARLGTNSVCAARRRRPGR